MADIVLIDPPLGEDSVLGSVKKVAQLAKMIPLGLGYLARYLLEEGFSVKILDAFAEELSMDETVKRALAENPYLVGITVTTPSVYTSAKIAKAIKTANKNIFIAVGNTHPTIFPDELLGYPEIDFVVRGEGELTFAELAVCLKKQAPLHGVQGLSYRSGGQIIHNDTRPLIDDLDAIPFPAYHLMPMKEYQAPPHWLIQNPCYQIITSRGCPYRCGFCAVGVMGKKYRVRSPRNVCDEIEFLIDNYGAKGIMFWDAIFSLTKDTGLGISDEIKKRGIHKKIAWAAEVRCDRVDEELARAFYSAGCRVMALGIESGSQRVLDIMHKGTKLEDIERGVRILKEAGIALYGSFVLGYPGETLEEARTTIDFACRLNLDQAKFNRLVPYPGTEIFSELQNRGAILSYDWNRYSSFSEEGRLGLVYRLDGVTEEELGRVQKEAFRKFFLRPQMIMNQFRFIRSWDDVKRNATSLFAFMKFIRISKKRELSSPHVSSGLPAGRQGIHSIDSR